MPGFILKAALTFEWQLLSRGGVAVKMLLKPEVQQCHQGLGKRQLSTQNKQGFWQGLTEFAAKRLYSQPEQELILCQRQSGLIPNVVLFIAFFG